VVNLTEGWRQLIPAWRAPLASIGARAALDSASLISLADDMARQGVADRAVEFYLEAGEAGRALETAAGLAGELARGGCWPTMIRLARDLTDQSAAIPGRPFEQDGVIRRQARPRWWRRLPGRRLPDQADVLLSRSDRAAPVVSELDVAPRRALKPSRVITGSAFAAPVLKASPAVTVHLLGELQVVFGERPVGKWVSGRGRAVFEYLVFHRHSRVRRERLMNVFWPDAAPDAARNSLNVAIHGLRQSLRPAAGDRPVVVHRDGTYFIEPALDIWVDVEVFEEQLKSARQRLAADDYAMAQAELENAIELYQGDFLADDPYEEWAHITREHLRLAYLDCLDQLCCLRFEVGDYRGCVETCLKLLACDNCREDTLRRLMRSSSRLGRPQLALRQYHSCAAALRRELQLSPAAATTELAGRIMRRQAVLAFAGRGEHARGGIASRHLANGCTSRHSCVSRRSRGDKAGGCLI
jgi:DNA-binding SARP family transcriptional activator